MHLQEFAKNFVTKIAALPGSELTSFAAEISPKEYAVGSFFTEIGDAHDRVGLIVKGLFRVYYLSSEGELHVRNFCKEGMLLGSYATILSKQRAHVNIEALEPSLVLEFPYQAITKRYDQHPGWERLGRKVAEDHYISRERREFHLLTLDATARLEQFHQDFPALSDRLTKANIASYIGVKPETLSRLEGKVRKKRNL